MRAALLGAALLLAGCTGGAPDPDVILPTEEHYLGGGVVELDHDTGGGSVRATVWPNVTALRMELVYHAVASLEPRVFGLPGCEWRIHAPYTMSETETIDCFEVVPGEHEIRVEHDGGELRMAVRVLGEVPAAARSR